MKDGFKSLIAWQKAYKFALVIYKLSSQYPANEQYGLTSQIRRASISIPSNIAEGYERKFRKEYVHFLSIAKGSLGEVETQLLFSKDLGYLNIEQYRQVDIERQELAKVLNGLIKSLT
jgi:four helix bundle protein